MTTFGFSAFLKLIHLNERPKRTALRERLRGTSEGGYDYHRSLRGLAKKLVLDGHDLASVTAEANAIKNLPERNSAKGGLLVLGDWKARNVAAVLAADRVTIESPSGLYKVTYPPDFGADIRGVRTAVHIWNTMRPDLEPRLVLAALAPFFDQVAGQGFDEIAVLSLQNSHLFHLGDPRPYLDHAAIVLEHIEHLIDELDDDGRRPPAEDRPSP